MNHPGGNKSERQFGDEASEVRPADAVPEPGKDAPAGPGSVPVKLPNQSGTLELPSVEFAEPAVAGTLPARRGEEYDSVVVRKNQRISAKVEAARRLLERLPAGDGRVRLLHAATVRRDEVLLDALLEELSSKA